MTDLMQQIMTGDYDDRLDTILDAVSSRRKYLAAGTLRTIKIGDTVRFNEHASPKYLIGVTATVVGKTRTKIELELAETTGRFPAGTSINTPLAIIDLED